MELPSPQLVGEPTPSLESLPANSSRRPPPRKLNVPKVACDRKQSIVPYPTPARMRDRGPSLTCTRTRTSESASPTVESGSTATVAYRYRSVW